MNEFTILRQRAREKRDKAIDLIRKQYADTLQKIAVLEQDMTGRLPADHRSMASCIEAVIPTDREFTTRDIMASLEAMDTNRDWSMRGIVSHISTLRERGLVKRLRKSKNTEPAVYVRIGVEVKPEPFQDMTLVEVVAQVLGDGPLTLTELAVRILEQGYVTTMRKPGLRTAIGTVLRKNPQFREQGGKWISARGA